jgi:beta-galactosidase
MDPAIDKHREEIHQRVGISEYGAGANTAQHQEGPLTKPQANRGPFHPEEWQTWVHENDWANIQDNASLWGTFIWCMFDFQSDGRREGSQPDLNDKGLVTQDRSIKKDAYFFYQANWSDKPMVYIASRRMVQRKQPTTEVKVFSNCDQVELSVNGTSLGTAQPNNVKTFRWPNVALQPGKNQIAATGTSSQGKVTDSCEWELGN